MLLMADDIGESKISNFLSSDNDKKKNHEMQLGVCPGDRALRISPS